MYNAPGLVLWIFNMIKILAFDVSETLQTGSEQDDNGLGQPMLMGNEVIPGAFSVMVGGQRTAELLQEAQKKGITLVLVTNNGADLDREVISRTLDFLKGYGVIIEPENYMGPPRGTNGSKVPRLEEILRRFNITKDEIVFFDDSSHNVTEARSQGFTSIQVKSPEDLQSGILEVINAVVKPSISASNSGFFSHQDWEQLDFDVKAYVSEMTRSLRVESFNHITTSEYWRGLDAEVKEYYLQQYSQVSSYNFNQ